MTSSLAFINSQLVSAKVVIFSEKSSSYSTETKRIIEPYISTFTLPYDEYLVVEIDTREDYELVLNDLRNICGRKHLPMVFIDQTFVGGCAEVQQLELMGKLEILLTHERFRPQNENDLVD